MLQVNLQRLFRLFYETHSRKSVTFRETVSETVPKRHEGDGLGKNEGHHVNQRDELGLG